MTYLFAPMEGITGRVYRRVHRRHFPGIDRYYAPFYSPTADGHFNPKSLLDLQPEENPGVPLVPQLLTNRAEDFIWAAEALGQRGYREINLNLGCPSGTVFAKKKGSGFLGMPDALDAFLEQIYASPRLEGLALSVKTRIGVRDPEEFARLLEIFRRYPIPLLIIHPRLRQDFYTGPVHPEAFAAAQELCPFPLAWNGDLFCAQDVLAFREAHPETRTLMLGRGLIADPGLVTTLLGGAGSTLDALVAFHDDLCREYQSVLYGSTALCHRMKEIWAYMIHRFADSEKHFKRLCKSKTMSEYRLAADAIFQELTLL